MPYEAIVNAFRTPYERSLNALCTHPPSNVLPVSLLHIALSGSLSLRKFSKIFGEVLASSPFIALFGAAQIVFSPLEMWERTVLAFCSSSPSEESDIIGMERPGTSNIQSLDQGNHVPCEIRGPTRTFYHIQQRLLNIEVYNTVL